MNHYELFDDPCEQEKRDEEQRRFETRRREKAVEDKRKIDFLKWLGVFPPYENG